uniref:Uncharacterized protein n=1 Tax=Sphaeramia orbicularis TaxID=375764 RepID=A0A673BVG6_9TELE
LRSPSSSVIIQEVMEEEWSALRSEAQERASLWGSEAQERQFDEVSGLEDIHQELLSHGGSSAVPQNAHGFSLKPILSSIFGPIFRLIFSSIFRPIFRPIFANTDLFLCFSTEMSIIAEYEQNIQLEQQYVSSVVDEMEELHVICPVCHR